MRVRLRKTTLFNQCRPCNAVSRRLCWSTKSQAELIERVTGDECKDNKWPRTLLRLLIDEIVDDLSRSGSRFRSRPVQKPRPRVDAVFLLSWIRRKASPSTNRGVEIP